MVYQFTKMQGAGNDYIYFNCLERELPHPEKVAVRLSDRHFGIGGDGIVLICPSDVADAKMRMFNNDGSEGRMCGNAIRCVGKYLYDHKLVTKKVIQIETLSGIKTLLMDITDDVATAATVDMGKAILTPAKIPVTIEAEQVVNHPVTVDGQDKKITCVSMGNPHCVLFVDDVEQLKLETIGPKYENSPIFPDRVNTEFVQILDRNTIRMRVWERGSGETLACGTGACAAVVASVLNGFCPKGEDVLVKLNGGDLVIRYTDETVSMTGPAEEVFTGEIEL